MSDEPPADSEEVAAHMGCTSGGTIGAKSVKTLDVRVELIQDLVDACRKVRKDVLCMCHGGPIAMPDDAQFIIERAVHGTYNVFDEPVALHAVLSPAEIDRPALIDVSQDEPWRSIRERR